MRHALASPHLICQWPYNLAKLHYKPGTYPAPLILSYTCSPVMMCNWMRSQKEREGKKTDCADLLDSTQAGGMCLGSWVWRIQPMRTFMLHLIRFRCLNNKRK